MPPLAKTLAWIVVLAAIYFLAFKVGLGIF